MKLRKFLPLFLLTALFSSVAGAYWIQHVNTMADLDPSTNPEQWRPAEDGGRPAPGKPPAPFTFEILPMPQGMSYELAQVAAKSIAKWDRTPGSSMRIDVTAPGPGEVYDGNWSQRVNNADGRNTLEFLNQGWPASFGTAIAITVPRTDPSTGKIIEADIFCNAYNYRWVIFEQEGQYPELGDINGDMYVDAEAIITHEGGHLIGLGHPRQTWACMYAFPGLANTRARRLTDDDFLAVRYLYPGTAADVPPPDVYKVAQGTFGDGQCGQTYLSQTGVSSFYSERIERTAPLASGSTIDYCLFGSGFNGPFFGGMDLSISGATVGAVTGATWVGPNFVKAKIINDSGSFPPIAGGVYDMDVSLTNGVTGALDQGFVLSDSANALPIAVIQPSTQKTVPGAVVTFDAAGSADPDGDTITYDWEVVVTPPGTTSVLSSDTAAVTSTSFPAPGSYVVRLVVNDGMIDGIADQVVIRVDPRVPDDDDSYSPTGCYAGGRTEGPGPLAVLFLIVPFYFLGRAAFPRES